MQSRPLPKFLSVTVLHDGRVLLELLADWRTSLAVAESRVDAGERTTDLLVGWATSAQREPGARSSARSAFAEAYRDGYAVSLPGSDREIVRTEIAPATMERGFMLAYGDAAAGSTPAAARDFARDVGRWLTGFSRRSQRLAETRLAGGGYLSVLQAYLDEARVKVDPADQNFHLEFSRGIGAILDDERYLLLSEDAGARKLYRELEAERSDLYNWYMNLARGGVAGPRRPRGA